MTFFLFRERRKTSEMLREERKECVSSGATRRLEAVAGWKVDRVYRRSINTVYICIHIYMSISTAPEI